MKRIFFLSLGLGLGLLACNSDKKADDSPKNTDLIQQNLKGKVQEIDEVASTIDSAGKSKTDSTVAVSIFDEKGYNTQYYTKGSAGKHLTDQTLTRNPDGTFAVVTYMKNGKQTSKLVTETKDGKYTGGKNYDSTGKQDGYYDSLKTNEYGIVYAGTQHFMSGKIKSTFEMKYDGVKFTGGTSKDSTGKTTYTGSVKNNDKGDPSEETTTTDEKGVSKTEVVTYKYELDDKGNWTQRTTMNDKGKPTKIVKRTITYFKD